MNSNTPKKLQLTTSLLILIGVHFALDLLLISRSWYWTQTALIIVLAIPISQLSLLTLWVAMGVSNPVLRFALPMLGIAISWVLMSRILPWGIGDPATAGWAIALAIQACTIFVALRFFVYLASRAVESRPHVGQMSFGVSSLMLWTTAIAVALGFVQFGRHYWQWTGNVFQWGLLSAMPIIGITNGLVAALWLWGVQACGLVSLGLRIAVSLQLTGGLAMLAFYASTWVTGQAVLDLGSLLLVVCSQGLMISLSLAVAMTSYKNCPDSMASESAVPY